MMANRRKQRAHFAVITERERIADALTRDVRRLTACCLRRNKWSGSRSLLRCQPRIRILTCGWMYGRSTAHGRPLMWRLRDEGYFFEVRKQKRAHYEERRHVGKKRRA